MDDDELLVSAACIVISAIVAARWYLPLFRLYHLVCPARYRVLLAITPPLCLALDWMILRNFADLQVRNDHRYLILFLAVGGVSLSLTILFLRSIGLSDRDDALERRNTSAATAICAAMISVSLCFCGANIGAGPTIWTTLGPAALAVATLFLAWFTHAILGPAAHSITIDRDSASAARTSAFYISSGVLLGNAVAGDWVSTTQTLVDMISRGWPVAPLVVIALLLDRWLQPTADVPKPSILKAGILPGAALIFACVPTVRYLGAHW